MLKGRPPAVTASAQEGLESEGETGIRICQLLDYWIPCTFTSPGLSDLLGPMEMSAGNWRFQKVKGKLKLKMEVLVFSLGILRGIFPIRGCRIRAYILYFLGSPWGRQRCSLEDVT